jgi:hypothetical protein
MNNTSSLKKLKKTVSKFGWEIPKLDFFFTQLNLVFPSISGKFINL